MKAGNSSKFDVLTIERSGNQGSNQEEEYIFIPKRRKSKHLFFTRNNTRAYEIIWRKEWGGELFFSHGTKHSKGVCILINPSVQPRV